MGEHMAATHRPMERCSENHSMDSVGLLNQERFHLYAKKSTRPAVKANPPMVFNRALLGL